MVQILKNCSILYVEDEPEIQANISEYLKYYFKDVHLTSDGAQALKLYQKLKPQVLLLDINIPSIDGLTLAKKIRQTDQTVKIIMLTAYTEKEKLLLATELKLTKYLIKPVEPRYFKEALKIVAKELNQQNSQFQQLGNGYHWDKSSKQLLLHDKNITLSTKEQKLLELFINKANHTVHYTDIMVAVWENSLENDISIDSIKNLVSKLRKKIPNCNISNVYGSGYMLNL